MEVEGHQDAKRGVIHAAAIEQFAARGFAGTSMANIAEAAGMSRPTLYQYFRNKGDIFASAFVALFEERVADALLALEQPGSVAQQIDGFLQRYEGDLWQRMATSPHTDEIASVKNADVADAVTKVVAGLWDGFDSYLRSLIGPAEGSAGAKIRIDEATRGGWRDLLRLSPKGLKIDQPSVDVYRRRLTTLASSVAADIDVATKQG